MLYTTSGLVSIFIAIALAIFGGTLFVIVLRQRARHQRLLSTGADLEFIALLNDRIVFCDSEEEFNSILRREASEPPPPLGEANRGKF